jgi:hypothetical protein
MQASRAARDLRWSPRRRSRGRAITQVRISNGSGQQGAEPELSSAIARKKSSGWGLPDAMGSGPASGGCVGALCGEGAVRASDEANIRLGPPSHCSVGDSRPCVSSKNKSAPHVSARRFSFVSDVERQPLSPATGVSGLPTMVTIMSLVVSSRLATRLASSSVMASMSALRFST